MNAIHKQHLIKDISALFARTQVAHRQYELATLGGARDAEWARWYARYLLENGLPALLTKPFTLPDLEEWLMRADDRHRANAPEAKWEEYYAEFFLTNL